MAELEEAAAAEDHHRDEERVVLVENPNRNRTGSPVNGTVTPATNARFCSEKTPSGIDGIGSWNPASQLRRLHVDGEAAGARSRGSPSGR